MESELPPVPLALPAEDKESGNDAAYASSVAGDTSQPEASPSTAEDAPTAANPPSEEGGQEGQEGQEGCDKEGQRTLLVQHQAEDGVTVATSEVVLSTSDSTAHLGEGKPPKSTQEQYPSPSPSPPSDISIEPVSMVNCQRPVKPSLVNVRLYIQTYVHSLHVCVVLSYLLCR